MGEPIKQVLLCNAVQLKEAFVLASSVGGDYETVMLVQDAPDLDRPRVPSLHVEFINGDMIETWQISPFGVRTRLEDRKRNS